MKRWLILIGIAACGIAIWQKQETGPTQLRGRAMGCDWKLVTTDSIDPESVRSEVVTTLEHWEQVLSTWRKDSDLSRLNRGEAATPDLQRVVVLAEKIHQDTGGAFDHRLLAQLTAAGFGPGGTGIDLSSIGKGFAVDRVSEQLHARGIHHFAFSLAGEIRTGDGSWPVGIESPSNPPGTIIETIDLTRRAMATSGNTRQWIRMEQGKPVSHILNPATGRPVLRPPCSVTVIAPDAAHASAWATALFVLGPEANSRAESHGYRVIWHGNP